MRDLVLLLAFLLLLYPVFKKPFIAVSLWLWTALFFPNGWVFGIAASVKYNLIFAILTICGIFFLKERPKYEANSLTILITIFTLWVSLTYAVGIGDPDLATESWVRYLKVIALYYCVCAILTKKHHIDFFIWSIVLSVAFYATLEGLKLIASGGGHHIKGITGHVFDDRNDLALAINMTIPLVVYLRNQYSLKIIKISLLSVVILMVLCVLGTYSRGGLIGLLVLGLVFFKETNNKLISLITMTIAVFIGISLMPPEWFSRMDTIQDADNDSSFLARVVAWKVSILIALDNPIFGGGFKAMEYYPVWLTYALQLNESLTFIETPPPDLKAARAAHSVYFQVLGDQGFIGLFLFLLIIGVAYKKLSTCISRVDVRSPFCDLAKMLKLSIIMYLVVGIALSRAYFDLSFAIYALVRVTERKVATEWIKP